MPRVKRRRSRAREGGERGGSRARARALVGGGRFPDGFGFSCLRLACHGTTTSYPSIGRVRCGFQMGEIKTTARTTERSASIEFDGLDSSMSQHCDVPLVDKFYFKLEPSLCPCSSKLHSCQGFLLNSGNHSIYLSPSFNIHVIHMTSLRDFGDLARKGYILRIGSGSVCPPPESSAMNQQIVSSNPRRVRIPRVGAKPGMELHLQILTHG